MKTLGERIRQAREYRGWSGADLAHRAGYKTQSGISNLENRASGTGGRNIKKIADALNVSIEWLMHGPDSDIPPFLPPLTPFEATKKNDLTGTASEPENGWDAGTSEALQLFRGLSHDGRQQALTYLRFLHAGPHGHNNPHPPHGEDHPVSAQKAA